MNIRVCAVLVVASQLLCGCGWHAVRPYERAGLSVSAASSPADAATVQRADAVRLHEAMTDGARHGAIAPR